MFSIRAICAVGLILFCTLSAPADDTPIPQIPDAIKQSVALDHDQIQAINQALDQVTASLADGSNPTAQSLDRQWIIDAVADSTGAEGSDDYEQHYTQSLNDHLLPRISAANANFRAKIEAGLAIQQVAERNGSTALTPVAIQLLQDRSPAVAWAGMKAARGLLKTIFLQSSLSATDKQLVDAVIDAVNHQPDPPLGGPIAEEAYQAFLDPVLSLQGNIPPAITAVLVPNVMKLWRERIDLYKNGPPDSPGADTTGMIILLSRAIWPTLQIPQQHDVLQATADLISLTAKWAIAAKSDVNSGIDPAPLVDALQRDGRELHQSFADPSKGDAPNQALFDGTAHLQSLGPGSGVDAIQSDSAAAVQALNDFAAQLQ
jgi:hypothetical protein